MLFASCSGDQLTQAVVCCESLLLRRWCGSVPTHTKLQNRPLSRPGAAECLCPSVAHAVVGTVRPPAAFQGTLHRRPVPSFPLAYLSHLDLFPHCSCVVSCCVFSFFSFSIHPLLPPPPPPPPPPPRNYLQCCVRVKRCRSVHCR